jgi:hypothetical protein
MWGIGHVTGDDIVLVICKILMITICERDNPYQSLLMMNIDRNDGN